MVGDMWYVVIYINISYAAIALSLNVTGHADLTNIY